MPPECPHLVVANFSIVERERDFTSVEWAGTVVQYWSLPREDIRVRRRGAQGSLPYGLFERRAANLRGGSDCGIEFKWSRLRIIAPVGVDNRVAVVAECFANQPVQLPHSHRTSIGTV